ncbi:MAG: nuclear transport factor 2 family protein [Oscillospiraceae bacterium]|nr:nuclear transport factor 2 family protein [Oscillospiraceae bacterium]
METKTFTNEEQVERIWDRENVIMTMNRRGYYFSNDQRQEELDTLWVRCPENRQTASFGVNSGYYAGMEEIARWYVEERKAALEEKLRPFVEAGQAAAEDIGLGVAAINTVTTPLVYIAEDGRSARYLGYRLGFQATGKPDGDADCYLDFGLIYADLLKEDGVWRIWHLVQEHDHTVEVGAAYADVPVLQPFGADPLEREFGTPTIRKDVYQPLFGWEYMWQDMPRPFETYKDEESYGPKGMLGVPYYERDKR